MLPVERAATKLVLGQVYNERSLFQRCMLMVKHDKGSDGGFLLLWWIDKRHELFCSAQEARRDVMLIQILSV